MKKLVTAAIIIMASLVFSNGLSLNSVGPKAFGMGGAFVGLADDPTAIHWNPAGMIGQNNSVYAFMTDVIPMPNYENDAYGIDAEGITNHYISPNIMGVYNYKDFAFGWAAYVPAGLGAEWDGADLLAFSGPPSYYGMQNLFAGKEFDWMSKIGIFNMSPAVAYNINDQFKIGAALNFFYGMFEMKRGEDMINNFSGMPYMPGDQHDGLLDTQTEMDIDGTGIGGTFSLLIDNDAVAYGLTFKTPVTVEFDGTIDIEGQPETCDMELDVTWPAWVGAGLAFKPFDGKWVMTADVQFTNWAELEKLVAKVYDIMTPMGVTMDQEMEMNLNWNDAIQVRFGTQFQFNEELTLRGGYYYDPAPAGGPDLNILFPSSTNQVFTIGGTYLYKDFTFDLGTEYVFGSKRPALPTHNNMPGNHQMDIFSYSLGVGYTIR